MADIFDSLSTNQKLQNKDIFDDISERPSRGRSIASAPIKGAIKGAHELAAISDPLKALLGLNELNPHQKQAIEKLFPTQNKPLEKGLERAGRIGVSAIGGPETLLAKGARTLGGAALGQLAEETGAPESIQNLAELSAFISPKFGKQLLPKKSQAEAVEFLRKKGLTDREITPLLKSEKTIRTLGRLSKKGDQTKSLTRGISEKLGENYDILKTEGSEKFLKGNNVTQFDERLSDTLEKIRPRFARLIEKDVEALRNKGISQKNLIDFYQDINDIVGAEKGGKAVLSTLKKPILEGLEKIDPKAAQEFSKLNEFYAKKAILSKSLKPDIIDKWLKKGKVYASIAGLATGNLAFLKGALAEEVGSRIFRQMLTNPRLQNLSNQMLKAIEKNKVQTAIGIYKVFKSKLEEIDPKLAKELIPLEEISEGKTN